MSVKPPSLNLSPLKNRGSSKTPEKKKQGFPTTPRSVEKQRKMLQARLKRLMEHNLRLSATNQVLEKTNKQLLDQAIVSFINSNRITVARLLSKRTKSKR